MSQPPHPIDEPLSREISDGAVNQYVWISMGQGVVWVVEVSDDSTSAVLPAPPSNFPSELLGRWPRAMVSLERQIDSDEGVFWPQSWGEQLELDVGE